MEEHSGARNHPPLIKQGSILYILSSDLLTKTLKLLNHHGVVPMPLKGVLLQRWVYEHPSQRPYGDVDLLIHPQDLTKTREVLANHNYQELIVSKCALCIRVPNHKLLIDLHWRLFAPGLFSLNTEDVLERGTLNESLFDGKVVLPHPLDLYAHLVGHFAKGRMLGKDTMHLKDLITVAKHFSLAPSDVAQHLEKNGLSRAALYTLSWSVASLGDPFAAHVLECLPRDALGMKIARAVSTLLSGILFDRKLAALPMHTLNSSLLRAMGSANAHVWYAIKEKVCSRS